MGINLLEELDNLAFSDHKAPRYKVAFFLTYTINLQFFEQLVLPKLERLGVPYIGILTDRWMYQDSLSGPLSQEKCGKRYVLGYSPQLRTLQHGKLLWLHGDEDTVYVGSHNLTRAGFNDQLELTARLSSSDPEQVHAISEAHNVISNLVGNSTSLLQIWNRVRKPETTGDNPSYRFLWSGNDSLLSQLYSVIGRADSIRIVTPFLDSTALSKLSKSFSAPSIILDLPSEGADTPLAVAINAAPDIEPRTLSVSRRLHAKAYEFTVNNEHRLALGSANCTQAGLIKSVSGGGNSEFLVLIPARLEDEEDIKFEPVSDAIDYPGTGRRWDENDRPNTNPVTYFSATYDNKELSIAWVCDSQLFNPRVVLDNRTYNLEGSPSKLLLDEKPPQSIVLSGLVSDKEISTKAWIVFSEDLDAHAANIFINRRRSYLESTDPFQQVQGIDYELLQVIRVLLSSSENLEIESGVSARQRLSSKTVEDSIYVFDFSPDHDDITYHASRMIVGNNTTDPLALIRGLLAKIYGPIPKEHTVDEASIEDYIIHQTEAKRKTANILINHLRRIKAISYNNWDSIPIKQAEAFLRATFGIIPLLYLKTIRLEQEYTGKFTEEVMEFLKSIIYVEKCRNICKHMEVCGPFVITIGTIADSTSDEYERGLLRKYLKQITADPHRNVYEWAKSYPEQALLILRTEKEVDLDNAIQSRIRPVDHLMGIADQQLLQKQQGRWGLLLQLVKAVQDGDSIAGDLRQEAEVRFKDHPVWLRSKSYLDAGIIPPIMRVNRFTCGECHIALPYTSIRQLEKGEAVVCSNCYAILLFGKLMETGSIE